MKGKRLPELAAGALEPFFNMVCEVGIMGLMTEHQPWLKPESWTRIVHIFEHGKALLWTGLQIKMDFAQRLPWSLAALAHSDAEVGRQHARNIVRFFDEQSPEVQALHHPVALRVLQEGSTARSELVLFIGGENMAQLPVLARAILPLKFVPIVERYIEGAHSIVKRHVHWRHTPPLLSLARRFIIIPCLYSLNFK